MQATKGLAPQRLDWLEEGLETDPNSDTILWIGCLPHFAAYFDQWSDNLLETARSGVRLLNRLGIKPHVAAEERCCGHDALWGGDTKTFEELAREGFSDRVLTALEGVTKRPEEGGDAGYEAFVKRAAKNPLARRVKIADLLDNMDLTRLSELNEHDFRRLDRYLKALRYLEALDT
jgi:hypothetical protein